MKNPKELYQKLIKKLKLIDNPPISYNYHIYNYLSHIYDIIKIKSKNTLAIIYTYITKKYYSSLSLSLSLSLPLSLPLILEYKNNELIVVNDNGNDNVNDNVIIPAIIIIRNPEKVI
jgi:hypothetical protein